MTPIFDWSVPMKTISLEIVHTPLTSQNAPFSQSQHKTTCNNALNHPKDTHRVAQEDTIQATRNRISAFECRILGAGSK